MKWKKKQIIYKYVYSSYIHVLANPQGNRKTFGKNVLQYLHCDYILYFTLLKYFIIIMVISFSYLITVKHVGDSSCCGRRCRWSCSSSYALRYFAAVAHNFHLNNLEAENRFVSFYGDHQPRRQSHYLYSHHNHHSFHISFHCHCWKQCLDCCCNCRWSHRYPHNYHWQCRCRHGSSGICCWYHFYCCCW